MTLKTSKNSLILAIFLILVTLIFPLLSFARVFIVDKNHPQASDNNPGTENLPFKTISRAVRNLRPGDIVLIKAGVYRESVTIKAKGTREKPIIIKAYPGDEGKVIIKGSEIFRNWKQIPGTNIWFIPWKYKLNPHYPKRWKDFGPYAKRCELVFVNGKPLRQVLTKKDLKLWTFYVDDHNKKLFISLPPRIFLSNPVIEVSIRQRGIVVKGRYLIIKGIAVMQVANHHPNGAFSVVGENIILENCRAEWNNLDGFYVIGKNFYIIKCIASHNGRCGITASIHNSIIAKCITNYNSWRFGPVCHAGGIKIVGGGPSNNLIITHISIGNNDPGIWFDYGCRNNRVNRSLISENVFTGIIIEASSENNFIVNNIIFKNKVWKKHPQKTGAGIIVRESSNVWIVYNTIYKNQRYGIVIAGGKRKIYYTNKDVINQKIFIINNIISDNKVAGLAFWVWDESATASALLSHKSDFNLWWPKNKWIEIPSSKAFWRKTILK
ncbi:MAG TPA: DUF1565 domain-containing protein [Candidatus Desulfofervidus auxilii]|uniref:DUF1565 domain-containing protein n=1 Tax=Desulfofervidus auxilii TaxID=1621989 RepID=A0A7C0U2Z8_DESA2|nr:DUF1565 domain-containing protein [Candidatus Desulfofervidus auxilii]